MQLRKISMRGAHSKMMKLTYLVILAAMFSACSQNKEGANNNTQAKNEYFIARHNVTVDGNTKDWDSIPGTTVSTKDHLWFGEGLPEGEWKGVDDLSFRWKTAHNDGKLFFLFEVKDDTLSHFNQEHSWMNDCIEIYLDHQNIGGDRITEIKSASTLEDRMGKRLRGHEMHFLPSADPKVFFDDTEQIYYTDTPQTQMFKKQWHGEVIRKKTSDGYLMEIGFAMPNYYAQKGQRIGVDVAVCDDDGKGRKSLLLWSGYKGEFWLTMDNFNKMTLK